MTCSTPLRCSFSTSADTNAYLGKAHGDLMSEPDVELVQNKSPKVDAASLEPATYPEDPEQEWCAPLPLPSIPGSGMLQEGTPLLVLACSAPVLPCMAVRA